MASVKSVFCTRVFIVKCLMMYMCYTCALEHEVHFTHVHVHDYLFHVMTVAVYSVHGSKATKAAH